jgi:hypothetical protein
MHLGALTVAGIELFISWYCTIPRPCFTAITLIDVQHHSHGSCFQQIAVNLQLNLLPQTIL